MLELEALMAGIRDSEELLELVEAESDEAGLADIANETTRLDGRLAKLEFRRMFPGEMDPHSAFLDIQAGAGGTEAQDWAEIVLRMYLRFCEARGWKTELMEASDGDVAGIKSASIKIEGDHLASP